jgi:hypothetical protein
VSGFRVNGHTVSHEGKGACAFRVRDGALEAFAGGKAKEISVDGRRTVFADQALDEIGWAPVAEPRRVRGGAVLMIQARGEGAVRVPAVGLSGAVSLYAEGAAPGSRGAEVAGATGSGRGEFHAHDGAEREADLCGAAKPVALRIEGAAQGV